MRSIAAIVILLVLAPASAAAQVLQMAELSSRDIARLDRERTVVIMPGGILEEHGPYLPAFTDGYLNRRLADRTAEAIVAERGGAVLMFPTIPLGTGTPEDFAGVPPYSGSYTVRPETLRAVYMDIASSLGQDGFRTIFVISRHGAPLHNSALLEAADYFNARYGGRMVVLTSLIYSGTSEEPALLDAEAHAEHGVDVHAGARETSQTLFLEPELVADDHRTAMPFAAASTDALTAVAAEADWPGYFGSPRLASASAGAKIVEFQTRQTIELALRILDGFDWRTLPTRAERGDTDPSFRTLNENAVARSERERISQDAWLGTRDVR